MNVTEHPRASTAGAPARPGVPVTQRTALLVAGMHRSGTSALAGMLSADKLSAAREGDQDTRKSPNLQSGLAAAVILKD